MATLPFVDANDREVYARVAYRIIEKAWKANNWEKGSEREHIWALAQVAYETYRGPLELYLSAYAFHLSRGLLMKAIRAEMVLRSRCNTTHRAVTLWAYKANRRR